MKKYQFCIRFQNIDKNSAASKAVLDCNSILSAQGYSDYTFTVGDNSNRLVYYYLLFKELLSFFISIQSGSLVAIQYPLLSINNVFKYFIKISRLKKIKFFCIVHDLESLRRGGNEKTAIATEVASLNAFDAIIVHNSEMGSWLQKAGVLKKMINLEIFDYLTPSIPAKPNIRCGNTIAFAGNLLKSSFIYKLETINNWSFRVFGPNFNKRKVPNTTPITYCGEFTPNEIPSHLGSKFGLLWDGDDINECDAVLGNYLRYNSPHKCSLYLASGMPVIAPRTSAAGNFLKNHNAGLLIDSLLELDTLAIDEETYVAMLNAVAVIQSDIVTGGFFRTALKKVEDIYER